MVHVSFLIGNLDKERGGAQQLLYDLCEHLPNDGFERTVYHLFGAGTFRTDFEATGTRVVALDAETNADPRAFARLVRRLRADTPDVLHTNSPISGLWGRTAARLADVPRVVSVEHHVHNTRRPLARTVDDFTLPLADVVVGVSETVTTSFAPWEQFVLDVTGTRVATIPNGVDVDAITTVCHDSEGVLDPYPIEPSDPIVGTVGRQIAEKGYRYLIDSMDRITDEHPNAKLLLVGDGPERTALERRARHRGLIGADGSDTVVFAGSQPSVPPFLAHFDIGAFPSLNESFGLALAESMAAGVPIVGTDIPPFRRLLHEGDAGVVVPIRNPVALATAIGSLLDDDARRKRLAAKGREHIERQFSVQHTAREYAELYRRLVSG